MRSMRMDPDMSIKSVYKGKTHYFCSQAHKRNFDDAPDHFTKG